MAEPLTPDEIERHIAILNESPDSDRIAASAIALAGSEDRGAILALARALRQGDFLARLDDTSDPSSDTRNLTLVFRTLAEHPTEFTGRLCELLYAEPEFGALDARINLLLSALAAVRPTSVRGADVFRASSQEGYAEVNGPLLIKNESPLALQVFEELIAGEWVEDYVKVDILHRAILPRRTSLPVLATCARLLERDMPPEVREGLIETLFDYQSRRWFGPARTPPKPPPWASASTEALQFLIALAARVQSGPLADRLRGPVQATRNELETIVRSRPR
jgi:hypothetical protein